MFSQWLSVQLQIRSTRGYISGVVKWFKTIWGPFNRLIFERSLDPLSSVFTITFSLLRRSIQATCTIKIVLYFLIYSTTPHLYLSYILVVFKSHNNICFTSCILDLSERRIFHTNN